MDSCWAFRCRLGLAQGSCGAYEPDPESRGYGRFGGCPSCVYREPYNRETAVAEALYQAREAPEPGPGAEAEKEAGTEKSGGEAS